MNQTVTAGFQHVSNAVPNMNSLKDEIAKSNRLRLDYKKRLLERLDPSFTGKQVKEEANLTL